MQNNNNNEFGENLIKTSKGTIIHKPKYEIPTKVKNCYKIIYYTEKQ